jgi:hypothetical protein
MGTAWRFVRHAGRGSAETGGHPAAQDGVGNGACSATRKVRSMQFAGNQAKFSFDGMEFATVGRGQIPGLQPRHSKKNHKNIITLVRSSRLRSFAAHRDPDQRKKFKGVRLNIDPGSCAWRPTMPNRKRPWTS